MAAIYSSLASLLPLLCLLPAAAAKQQQEQPTPALPPVTLPGCPDKCGNVSIPYPFGTREGCFRPGFFVVCNHTFDPPRPFIDTDNSLHQIDVEDLYYLTSEDGAPEMEPTRYTWPIELVSVSLSEGKARLLGGFSYDCRLNETHHSVRSQWIHMSLSPFLLSADDNVFMGIGIDIVAEQNLGPSCKTFIIGATPINGSCPGQGCCQAILLPLQHSNGVTIQKEAKYYDTDQRGGRVSCSYAMIVDKTWYNFSTVDLGSDAFLQRNAAGVVPIVADFIVGYGGCPNASEPTPKDFACKSDNSKCVDRLLDKADDNFRTYHCNCWVGYQGNPYILGGCQDIDECARPDMYPCHGKCKNTPGDYECSCPAGTRGHDAKLAPCNDLFSLPAKVSVGVVGGLFVIALLVFLMLIGNEKRKMTEFFQKNGGPTLERAKNIKIYKKEELTPILKPSNFIGRGAFGEVYKGFLDNQFVAVKKPIVAKKATDANDVQNDQFANEVIIQSQVIHKNIVRLIGCCLEVDKPMLVYEFISKGSLDDILHGSSCAPITLECRLNIAAESAEGLAYLHSKTTNTYNFTWRCETS